MKSAQVINICETIRSLDPDAADYSSTKNDLKKQLPAITIHACKFENNRRSNDTAWWNGLVVLEYDGLTEPEIKAFKCGVTPPENVKLAGLSCSGRGVWFILEVPDANHLLMEQTLLNTHELLCKQILNATGLDVSTKMDKQLDLARMRFLPCYDYIWYENIQDFDNEEDMSRGYLSMYGDIIAACANFEKQIPEGHRHETYKKYVVELAKITNNKQAMLKFLPDLGLDLRERSALINWGATHIEPQPQKLVATNSKAKPIDTEALPFPISCVPPLLKILVKGLPAQWQQTAAICCLPALSIACGQLSKEDGDPLAFQIALYGLPQSGKTKFSGRPATLLQEYLSQKDNDYRSAIELNGISAVNPEDLQCPKVVPFTDTSTVQLMKYLQYADNKTVMAYEGDLTSSLASSDSSFLDIKKLLRKGFNGETTQMDYKNSESFRGAVKARLSALVIGTPRTIFNYFNAQSTGEGNSRRVIMVEHEMIMKNISLKPYTKEDKDFIYKELDYLQSLPTQTVYHAKIEQAAFAWRNKKQKEANGDVILWAATQTPTEIFQRAAYLMWALFHFDESKIQNCCKFGKFLAEYQLRSYINNTYIDQQTELNHWQKRKAPSTQKTAENFNKQMLEELPKLFKMSDVVQYRADNNYPNDLYNQAVLTRWKNSGLISPTNDGAWLKI
jgi:hypothetical protein